MKRALALLLLGLLVAAAALGLRVALQGSRQVVAEPRGDPEVDADALTDQLTRALRWRTLSHLDRERIEADQFRGLQHELEASFPRVHAALRRERIADWSLLYHWPGSDPALPPLLLAAHQDVVPVAPGSEASWQAPPFSGEQRDGEVWGRGALDDKGSLVTILHAVETLLERGFAPRRGVLLAFGHDEEVGGERGARGMAARLAAQGVRPWLVLDEGGMVGGGLVPGLARPIALIGVAEKGSITLTLRAEAPGGHSSIPPAQSAVGIAAAAVRALETQRPRARLVDATRATLTFLTPELPLRLRLGLGAAQVFEPLLLRAFAASPWLDATVRTTTAATIIRGGSKENVLPPSVEAVVNFRILPGDSAEGVEAHARAAIDDERVQVAVTPGTRPRNPSAESPAEGPAFDVLQHAVSAHFPSAIVAPYLVVGGTDARHYAEIADAVYRFLPFRVDPDERSRLHGTDERIAVADLVTAVRFYRDLILRAQEPTAEP